MVGSSLLFAHGFTCVASGYEICKTGKSSKSDKVVRKSLKIGEFQLTFCWLQLII